MSLPTTISQRIETIKDPILNLSLSEMNCKYEVQCANDQITVLINTGFPKQYLEDQIIPTLQSILTKEFPHYTTTISCQEFIKAHKTQMVGKGLRGVKNTIAIASGKGGVGKSTVTVNLATALAKLGARVGILDADIYGPSMPLMLGQSEEVQIQDNFYLPVHAHGVQAMSIGYLTDSNQALIWRGPMLAKSLIQMLDITLWDNLDYLFIDLPPGTGDIQLTLVQKIPLTAAIVVTTPQNVATLDAQKAITMFSKTNIDVLGVIENMSIHQCSACGHAEPIFGEGGAEALCKDYNCSLLGQLPLASQVREDCDAGIPTATLTSNKLSNAFRDTAMRAVIELSKKPINYADKFPNIVVE
ncbi:iron-sulfur cluster carrier protein ApbC [Legionella waltersii]|uniref:Iron-sulfur cluster carrier protein n=1 Tax=Legionella waltersii TaxID=66969 RepID=A0A0W1AAI5_9GAMM|nr:iron-sulfur cluster carrier protein ApbC [Legionella waltersii]KTD78354.1 ATPase [Legionella waltersii]SNV06493.1 chromosome partitioning ATP-binding protein [Legionella waltersii]